MHLPDIVPIPHQRSAGRLVPFLVAVLVGLVAASAAVVAGEQARAATPRAHPGDHVSVSSVRVRALRSARRSKARAVNPLAALPAYVEPRGLARAQANAWVDTRPDDAALIQMIAEQPQGVWLGDWHQDVRVRAAQLMAAGRSAGAVPLLVAYNAPYRDCGQHSSGGAASAAMYRHWIDGLAAGIGADPSIVILEPDALAGLDCLSRAQRDERMELLAGAVDRLSRLPATAVYLDAGNPGWVPARVMARRLRAAGISGARGFSVNVSGFETTQRATAYGHAVSRLTGGAHFVIDTSRNGLGPSGPGDWCNPLGRALGELPSTQTGDPLIDAFMWVKRPGESDGTCNGGPPAGTWWPEYALDLARRAAPG